MPQQILSRRRFIVAGAGLAGLATLLAACGGGPSTTPGQLAASPPAATPAAQPTAANPTAAPQPSPTAAAAANATPAGASPTAAAASGSEVLLNGAGSSFDNPLFSKAFSEYTKLHPTVKVNYQAVGSGAGIQQLTKGTVDFGATDVPMTDDQIQQAGGNIVHVPVTLGPVSIAYNLPGVAEGIKIGGSMLADMFLGKITAWNDPAILKLNPDKQLPNTPIAIVHRSDSSGTTDIFTTYLAKVSPDWKQQVGTGTAVNWPVGLGGKGSDGVSGQVKQTPGAIGYFELAYAKQNNLTSAAIDNGAGDYLLPSSDGASGCAASAAANLPADLRVKIAGCTGKGAYPISGFSWIVLKKEQADKARGAAMANLFWWLVHDGQTYAAPLFYAPLPDPVVKQDEEKLRGITSGGQALLTV